MSLNNLSDELLKSYLPGFIGIREHIHAHPELSFQEKETAAFIAGKLDEWGVNYTSGLAGTGILATIRGMDPESRVIALRADMDALPIQELNDVPYRSTHEGIMHACGHDVHTTCLLGTVRLLQETRAHWKGTIQCIFQPGEEKHPGGASLLIQEGVLENPRPQAIFALHVYPHLPYGEVGFREGQYMASADEIYITVKGKGGHAALPHQTIDPVVIAANLLVSLQQIISRHCNPLQPSVLSFGKIQGGQAGNVIPDEVKLEGTLRCFDEGWRNKAHQLIQEQSIQLCRALGGDAEVHIPLGYPSLINDPDTTRRARALTEDLLGKEHVHTLDMRMAAEDFSYYTHQVPGCFFRLGTAMGDAYTYPVHHARFDIYPEAIGIGIRTLYKLATAF